MRASSWSLPFAQAEPGPSRRILPGRHIRTATSHTDSHSATRTRRTAEPAEIESCWPRTSRSGETADRVPFRRPGWHRLLGKLQVAVVLLLVAPSGIWMAPYAETAAAEEAARPECKVGGAPEGAAVAKGAPQPST